ncbi:MAG TPA: hypothetical protein VMS79_05595 [Methanomassiliicoccales archaeon]|nr:hypothetical protein [Methanomassiliicoccales archaeon]
MSGLTVGERIILYVGRYQKHKDSFDVPFDVSQDGIAGSLGISRAHAAIELKKLRESGEVEEKLAHIKRGRNKRKVYFLTASGEERAAKILQFAQSEGIDLGPLLDIRRSRGKDLYASLSPENKEIMAGASVFRKPFRREALPESSALFLPMDRRGMVDMPPELADEVESLLKREERRRHHSRAADYWLAEGDYQERLYHLIEAGRAKEAEMLIASKSQTLLSIGGEDLLESASKIESPSERYAPKVRSVQGELARMAGDHDYCESVCEEMVSSSDRTERAIGFEIRGRMLRDQGKLEDSLVAFDQASAQGGSDWSVGLDKAETLIGMGNGVEAIACLDGILQNPTLDPESLDRSYFLAGRAHLLCGQPAEALRFLSKGVAITKVKDKRQWYAALSEAYSASGMADKAKEYGALANPPKKWGQN